MPDELPLTGQLVDALNKLLYETGKRVDSFLSGPRPEQVLAADMTDEQLRQSAFGVASDLIDRIGTPLMRSFAEIAADDPDFRHWLPDSVRTQLLMMFAAAHDSFTLAATGLQHSATASVLGPVRSVAEALAVTRWLLDDPDERTRRRRGYALTLEELKRHRRLSEHLVKTAPDPSDARTLAKRLRARTKQAERDLRSLAAREDVSVPEKPKPRALFEQYMPNAGGYAFFALLSSAGARPGPIRFSVCYGDPGTGIADFDLQGHHDARAYWLAQGTLLHLDLCRLVAPVLGWEGWDAAGDALRARLEPLAEEAERRFARPRSQTPD